VTDAPSLLAALASGQTDIEITAPIRLDEPLFISNVTLRGASPQASLRGAIIADGTVDVVSLSLSCEEGAAITVRSGATTLRDVQVRATAGEAVHVQAGATALLSCVTAAGATAVVSYGDVTIEGGALRGASATGSALSALGGAARVCGGAALTSGDEAAAPAIALCDAELTLQDATLRGTPALSLKGASKATLEQTALRAQGAPIEAERGSLVRFTGPGCTVHLPQGATLLSGDGSVEGVATSLEAPASLCLELGQTSAIDYALRPDGAHFAPLIFTSSDATIASVDAQGNVTGLSVGEATIEIVLEYGASHTVAVTVTEHIPLDPFTPAGDAEQPLDAQPPLWDAFGFRYDVIITAQEEEAPQGETIAAFVAGEGGANVYSQPSAVAPLVARIEGGALAKAASPEGAWRSVDTPQGSGYVMESELTQRTWDAATAGTPALVIGAAELPEGTMVMGGAAATLPEGTLVQALMTAGDETAVLHAGEVVYLPAACVRLIDVQPQMAEVASGGWVCLYADASEGSSVLARLSGGVRVSVADDDGQSPWVLVRVGGTAGYVRRADLTLGVAVPPT
jgi:SH3-like domain-containing protein